MNKELKASGTVPAWWDRFLRNVAEMPGRTSPDDEPLAMIATPDELTACAIDAIGCEQDELLSWAVARWDAEVKNRPEVNVYRKPLDTTWRQVIRRLGGDDQKLVEGGR
jgi:hypothetical protein